MKPIHQQIFADPQGKLFENQIAHHIHNLNAELIANINSQAELLVGILQAFQFIDSEMLSAKEKKRIEALEAWCKDILENVNNFHLERMRRFTPKLANEIHTVDELKKEFDQIIHFMTCEMEFEEAVMKGLPVK